MCLVKSGNEFPKISRKPIKVYKVLEYVDGEYFTPVKKKKVKIGKTIKSKWWWVFGIFGDEITGAGVHAYTKFDTAANNCNSIEVIVRAEIPSYTPYWIGVGNEIAASKIKILQVILLPRIMLVLKQQNF